MKFEVVDCCYNLAKEEITICKQELTHYLRYLGEKRADLERSIEGNEEESEFKAGCAVLVRSEIEKLRGKIKETVSQFDLLSNQQFREFFSVQGASLESDSECEDEDGPPLSDQLDSDVERNDSLSDLSEENDTISTDSVCDDSESE